MNLRRQWSIASAIKSKQFVSMMINEFYSPLIRSLTHAPTTLGRFSWVPTALVSSNLPTLVSRVSLSCALWWTAISNVDSTLVEMECSFEEQFQFYLEICASCWTAKWKGESTMLKCDWHPFVWVRSLAVIPCYCEDSFVSDKIFDCGDNRQPVTIISDSQIGVE
jgi:hypothetical protein